MRLSLIVRKDTHKRASVATFKKRNDINSCLFDFGFAASPNDLS